MYDTPRQLLTADNPAQVTDPNTWHSLHTMFFLKA